MADLYGTTPRTSAHEPEEKSPYFSTNLSTILQHHLLLVYCLNRRIATDLAERLTRRFLTPLHQLLSISLTLWFLLWILIPMTARRVWRHRRCHQTAEVEIKRRPPKGAGPRKFIICPKRGEGVGLMRK
ncbi:hypothetical protein Patl1_08916 [Pistacia atlantica]|uniref:Uncharacterized protein n=1 Tax=Pistacia atlantica TaxID=434234 RepID=A0ACC1ALE0_9ROSI|nr:hypothetical protein Patl1_08916 [Pistacia atlantica]